MLRRRDVRSFAASGGKKSARENEKRGREHSGHRKETGRENDCFFSFLFFSPCAKENGIRGRGLGRCRVIGSDR